MSEEHTILEGKGLRKEFGGLVAVGDVQIGVERGELHSIIGPNGAGKTTLFNLLTGTLKPTPGQVLFKGRTSPTSLSTVACIWESAGHFKSQISFPS